MMRSMMALLLTGTLAFWSFGCETDTPRTGEPGSPPATQQEPGSPPDAQIEPGSPPDRDDREPGS
ncbi:MAG: hypothetical protein WD118_07740 [Phycisphaeraceae bacterium]